LPIPPRLPADPNAVEAAIIALRSGEPCTFLLNGLGVSEAGMRLVSRISARTGARFFGDTFLARIPRGAGRVDLPRLPYFAEQALEVLAGTRHLILVDTKAPVSFFAYPGVASELTPEGCRVHTLTAPGEDSLPALEAVAEAVGAAGVDAKVSEHAPPRLPAGQLNAESIAQSLGALLPDQAILVNEAVTGGFALPGMTASASPHDWLDLTGGAIGLGLPAAVGAAVACPDRRVVALQADGSAMYTIQSLWTMARENLDVTVILFANRKYAILQVEFMRVGAENPGPKAMDMLDLSRPDLDFVHLAKGMGVPAVRASDAKSFSQALADSFSTPGPYLIEAIL
jgi:acetolactate synthase-1/2/3 large subunit